MKHRITTDSHAQEFRMLRNRIEAEIQAPAVLLVTSATDRDGAGLTAYGLAESLSKTHQRAALVTTVAGKVGHAAEVVDESAETEDQAPRRRASDGLGRAGRGPGRLSIVAISHERLTTISRSNVAEMLAELRAENDYVVIDAGDLPNNSFGLLISTLADAILVSFLTGRPQVPGDRTMLDTLERSEAKICGVVMNDKAAIEVFVQQQSGEPSAAEATAPVQHEEPAAQPRRGFALNQRLEFVRQRIGKAF
jgi:Mrp family chromosome partitioning ATPase